MHWHCNMVVRSAGKGLKQKTHPSLCVLEFRTFSSLHDGTRFLNRVSIQKAWINIHSFRYHIYDTDKNLPQSFQGAHLINNTTRTPVLQSHAQVRTYTNCMSNLMILSNFGSLLGDPEVCMRRINEENGVPKVEAIVFKWLRAPWDFDVMQKQWGCALLRIKCCCFVRKPPWVHTTLS